MCSQQKEFLYFLGSAPIKVIVRNGNRINVVIKKKKLYEVCDNLDENFVKDCLIEDVLRKYNGRIIFNCKRENDDTVLGVIFELYLKKEGYETLWRINVLREKETDVNVLLIMK